MGPLPVRDNLNIILQHIRDSLITSSTVANHVRSGSPSSSASQTSNSSPSDKQLQNAKTTIEELNANALRLRDHNRSLSLELEATKAAAKKTSDLLSDYNQRPRPVIESASHAAPHEVLAREASAIAKTSRTHDTALTDAAPSIQPVSDAYRQSESTPQLLSARDPVGSRKPSPIVPPTPSTQMTTPQSNRRITMSSSTSAAALAVAALGPLPPTPPGQIDESAVEDKDEAVDGRQSSGPAVPIAFRPRRKSTVPIVPSPLSKVLAVESRSHDLPRPALRTTSADNVPQIRGATTMSDRLVSTDFAVDDGPLELSELQTTREVARKQRLSKRKSISYIDGPSAASSGKENLRHDIPVHQPSADSAIRPYQSRR